MRPRITSAGLFFPSRQIDHAIYSCNIARDSIDALPSAPGVYRFLDERGVPLYIGKSVNLRSRVLAHLRTEDEARMLHASRRVDFIRTAGEIGALLLESKLVKQFQPCFNVLLRYAGPALAIRLAEGDSRPYVAESGELDFGTRGVYGFYTSRASAEASLRALAKKHGLCPALLGLEKPITGRGCFARQIGRCRGACVGQEPLEAHTARLRAALEELQAMVWPFPGRIGIVEELDGWRQTHVIDRWCYLGSLEGRRTRLPKHERHAFDVDTYRILAKPMLLGELQLVQL